MRCLIFLFCSCPFSGPGSVSVIILLCPRSLERLLLVPSPWKPIPRASCSFPPLREQRKPWFSCRVLRGSIPILVCHRGMRNQTFRFEPPLDEPGRESRISSSLEGCVRGYRGLGS